MFDQYQRPSTYNYYYTLFYCGAHVCVFPEPLNKGKIKVQTVGGEGSYRHLIMLKSNFLEHNWNLGGLVSLPHSSCAYGLQHFWVAGHLFSVFQKPRIRNVNMRILNKNSVLT